jgi:lysine 6-dehydrogenase
MMGSAAAADLARSRGVEKVVLADSDLERARKAARASRKIEAAQVGVSDGAAVRRLMSGVDGVLSAVPYFYNLPLTCAAIGAGIHFCDLGGNSRLVDRQFALRRRAERARIGILPDCGLSPGLTSILVAEGVRRVGQTQAIRIRVGGLPQNPQPPLNYKLLFSVHGLLNEYLEPARIIRHGRMVAVESLTGLETIRFPGFGDLEAFYTSGGASTLPDTYAGRVRELDEKTIRYPGHAEAFRLLFGLGFGREPNRAVLAGALQEKLALPGGDVLLLRVDVSGRAGRICYELIERGTERLTAMMKTTAWPASILLQMLVNGTIAQRGVLRLEEAVPGEAFLAELARRGIHITATHHKGADVAMLAKLAS